MKKTEEQLALFEDMVKDNQLETEIKEQDKKFALLQDRKFAELDSLKSEYDEVLSSWYFTWKNFVYMFVCLDYLAAVRLQKIREYESKLVLKAKERQAIFEQAFETEIQQYKQSGIIPSNSILQSI